MRNISTSAPAKPGQWSLPSVKILGLTEVHEVNMARVAERGHLLVEALASHGVDTRLLDKTVGPTVTRFELELGAGVPIGAAMFTNAVAEAAQPGDHGSTYGGNLLACRAALVFLDALTTGGLMAHVSRVGRHMEQGLRALAAKHAFVKDVRGAGLIWGLELDREATAVVPQGLAHGVIVNRTAETVVRLLPPLVITEPEIDDALGRLDKALGAFGAA